MALAELSSQRCGGIIRIGGFKTRCWYSVLAKRGKALEAVMIALSVGEGEGLACFRFGDGEHAEPLAKGTSRARLLSRRQAPPEPLSRLRECFRLPSAVPSTELLSAALNSYGVLVDGSEPPNK